MTQRQTIVLMAIGIAMGIFLLMVVFGDNGLLELKHRRATHAELLRARGKYADLYALHAGPRNAGGPREEPHAVSP